MEYVKKIAYLILIVVGSFLGVQIGPAVGINGTKPQNAVEVTGHICGINLDGASLQKKTMANAVCDKFGQITNEQAAEILKILENCGDAN